MDTIRLERVQTFASEPDYIGLPPLPKTKAKKKLSSPPKKVKKNAVKEPSAVLSLGALRAANISVNGVKYNKLRRSEVKPLPVPHHVIPLFAGENEFHMYESMFEKSHLDYEKLTIREVLAPFARPFVAPLQKYTLSKLLFLTHFFKRILSSKVNYDVAVLCSDIESEGVLYNSFDQNICSVRLSDFAPNSELYGIIFKFRRQGANPVNSSYVDIMIAYDSACNIKHPEATAFLTGAHRKDPLLINLSIADSADIRIYNHNLRNPDSPIHWNTKVGELDIQTRNDVLFQPNRVAGSIDCHGWVDYVSRSLINWAARKEGGDFTFKYPTKGYLLQFLKRFHYHHPLVNPVNLPTVAFKKPTVLKGEASPQPSRSSPVRHEALPHPSRSTVRSPPAIPSSSSSPGTGSNDIQLVGFASHPTKSTKMTLLQNKRPHDTLEEEARKKAKIPTSTTYVNHFIPDLRARPRVPRPTASGAIDLMEGVEYNSSSPTSSIASDHEKPVAALGPIPTGPAELDHSPLLIKENVESLSINAPMVDTPMVDKIAEVVPAETTSVATTTPSSPPPPAQTTNASAKSTVDFSSIDSIFADALAQFEKDLDAIKIKL